jgi:hypothetical protein
MRNWKRFHVSGKMSTFMRSMPVKADEEATEVDRATSRGKSRKKPPSAKDVHREMLRKGY